VDKSFHHSCIDSLLSLLLCWLRWLLFDFLSPGEHRATSQSALTCRNWTGGVINSLAPDPAPEPRIGCTAALIGCTASRKVEICEAARLSLASCGLLWSEVNLSSPSGRPGERAPRDSRFGTLWYHWLCRIDQRVFGCIWGFTDGFLSEHGLFFAGDSHKTSLLCKSHRLLTRSWQLLRSGGLILSFLDTSGNSRSVSSACFYIKNGVNDDNVYCWWLSYIVNIVNGIILMVHNGSANEFLMVLPFLMVTIFSNLVSLWFFIVLFMIDQFTKILTVYHESVMGDGS
jgi:hypothetical protein